MSSLLCFDLGLKRTGVAVGQTISKTTQPVGLLVTKNGQLNWPKLDELILEWEPVTIVIGNPKTVDPHLNKLINRFKSHIQQKHKIAIIEIDEELTSVAANEELQKANLSTKKKVELRDQIAACLILESYFNTR